MIRISNDTVIFSMSDENQPAAYAKSGDLLVFETKDCYSNCLQSEKDLFGSVSWDMINPATGPVYFEGAEPGDALKVEIKKIDLSRQGVMSLTPQAGIFGNKIVEEITKVLPVSDGLVHFQEHFSIPIRPMIGVIGTAPADGARISTGRPGTHGGNMDCKEIIEGTTLYLPVNVAGGLLAMGDVHAVMGDGEVATCGAEIAAEITVKVTVVKQSGLSHPLLVNDTHIMTIYSAKTLDEAADGAAMAMQEFLTETLGVEAAEAVMLLSLAGDLKICQVVNPHKTCRVELPLESIAGYGISSVGKK